MIDTFEIDRLKRFILRPMIGLALFIALLWVVSLSGLVRAPKDFPVSEAIVIPRGLTASEIADQMEQQGVVRSDLLLYLVLLWRHDPSSIQAGTFIFERPLSVFAVADQITTLGASENLVVLTLPEGYTAEEFAGLASASLPNFDAADFHTTAVAQEGYLFPDTYYVPADFTAEELRTLLLTTFEQKTEQLQARIKEHPLGEYGVLTLASLLEREANTEESMKIVSGILQNRLQDGIRLQVDASMEYVLDRPLNTLSPDDLEIDSPYNTYLYGGLPPTPIGNPGLQSVLAVLEPTLTDYLYYITDEDGNFYYAETFDEHRENIAKYLQ
jgi:UPF0755 protein